MISVIVPAKNAAGTIASTLRSLVGDRDLIQEILLIDDDSVDGTAEVATQAARLCGLPLTVVTAKLGAAGAARNAGLVRARGKFVFFLDADDEVVSGGLGLLLDALRRDRTAGLAVGASIRRTDGRPDKLKVPHGYTRDRALNARNYLANALWPIAVGSALISRATAAAIPFPERLPFDEDTCYWAAALARTLVVTVPDPILVYNFVEARMASRFTSSPRRTFLAIAREVDKLADFGLDQSILQWRKSWIALRIARQLIIHKQFARARELMRAVRAHPEFRSGLTAFRYSVRIRFGLLLNRLCLQEAV